MSNVQLTLKRLELVLTAGWWPVVFLLLVWAVTLVSYFLALVVPDLWPSVADDPASFWAQLRLYCLGWDAATGGYRWQYPIANVAVAVAFTVTIWALWPHEVGCFLRALRARTGRGGALVLAAFVLLTAAVPLVFSPAAGGKVGVTPVEPYAAPGFRLIDQDGRVADSGRLLRGQPTLLTFLYTDCPDACPAVVSRVKQALERMGSSSDARVVVVTVNPGRDTPERLRGQMTAWKVQAPRWSLLTEQPAAIGAVLRDYRVAAGGEDPVTRTLSHDTVGFLVDRSGRVRYRVDLLQVSPEELSRIWSGI